MREMDMFGSVIQNSTEPETIKNANLSEINEVDSILLKNDATIQSLRPIDDVMFERLMENIKVCEEILRVLLNDNELTVVNLVTQRSIRNLMGRSVRLDVLCKLGDGKMCNIEVQKANNDDHQRRVRYNAAVTTANIAHPGDNFRDIPDLIMIYITEFDIFKSGRLVYTVKRYIEEDMIEVDNGLQEIYIAASNYHTDNSSIARLMKCFLETDANKIDAEFAYLRKEFTYWKSEDGGRNYMNHILEERDAKNAAEVTAKVTAEKDAEIKALLAAFMKVIGEEDIDEDVKARIIAKLNKN